jgi:hypothetical protein
VQPTIPTFDIGYPEDLARSVLNFDFGYLEGAA